MPKVCLARHANSTFQRHGDAGSFKASMDFIGGYEADIGAKMFLCAKYEPPFSQWRQMELRSLPFGTRLLPCYDPPFDLPSRLQDRFNCVSSGRQIVEFIHSVFISCGDVALVLADDAYLLTGVVFVVSAIARNFS